MDLGVMVMKEYTIFLKLQHWSLTIKCSSILYQGNTIDTPNRSLSWFLRLLRWLLLCLKSNLRNTVRIIIWVQGFVMNSWLMGLGIFDRSCNPVSAKVVYCKSHDHFIYRATDCLGIRNPPSSITGRHPRANRCLVGLGLLGVTILQFQSTER